MDNILQLVGNTPIIELKNIEKKYHLKSKIYAKLELNNPTGSIKDRTALNILKQAIKDNVLSNDNIIIEATSGNMGISLAFVGKQLGYKVIIVMPSSMSIERRKLVTKYGAELVLTDGNLGMRGAIDKVKEMMEKDKKLISLNQFTNIDNKYAHYITGNEILKQIPDIDIFLTGIGSSGTISGVGETLKKYNSNIKIIGIEPSSSPLLSKGYSGNHKIQGIGANFIPSIINKGVIDEVKTVNDDDAYYYCNELVIEEGIFCGISAGANLAGAIDIAKEEMNKSIVIIIPDRGDRYYSIDI